VNQRFSSLLAVVLGALALRLTFTGEYLNYVRRGMFVWLVLSGLVLIVLGIFGWIAARTAPPDDHTGCNHGHSHPLSRAVWLLIFPVLAVGLAQPAPPGLLRREPSVAQGPRPVLRRGGTRSEGRQPQRIGTGGTPQWPGSSVPARRRAGAGVCRYGGGRDTGPQPRSGGSG